jgi:nicotinamide-nucleotide amidase
MRISTLSIGDELICGQVIDRNAATISAALIDQGLRVQRHITVGDSELAIMGALADLGRASDAVIVTGGLGPTADDLTTHAAARATGRRLVINDEARSHIRAMSSKLDTLIVCQLSDKQAMIPSKTVLIPNPTGTACGFHLMHNGCFKFFLPGVPSEMVRMLHNTVIPFLMERVTRKRFIRTQHLNVFGPCEAEVDELLGGIARPDQGLQLGICVAFPAMRITLRAEADSIPAADALLAPAAQAVRERLKLYVYSAGDETLEETVAALMRRQDVTLALAESCTGGMIAQTITSLPGSSLFFREGAVTYSNEAKIRQLGIPADLIAGKGAVSGEVATAMSRGIRDAAGSDLGLAVTGIAGPDGGTEDKPVGTVFISLAAPDGRWTKRFQFSGSRAEIRTLTTWTALDWLRRYLLLKE